MIWLAILAVIVVISIILGRAVHKHLSDIYDE